MGTSGETLRIDIASSEGSAVVALSGELDMRVRRQEVESRIAAAIESVPDVVFDLERLTFCDSIGLVVILNAQAHANEVGTHLSFRNVLPNVSRVFDVSGITSALEVTPAIVS